MYTFNQYKRIRGNNINVGHIDTAMVIIPYKRCKEIRWREEIYAADGYYIKECWEKNKDKSEYIDRDLCYYNYLTQQRQKTSMKSMKSLAFPYILKALN